MAGQNVDHIDQPAGQAAKFLVTQANSAVHYRFLGAREFTRQTPDAVFVNAGNGAKDFSGIIRMLDGK